MRLSLACVASLCTLSALVSGCSNSGGKSVVPAMTMQGKVSRQGRSASNYNLVYSFGSKPNDGAMPAAGLILNGILYGTTQQGGAHSGCQPYGGCGTVFSIDQKETEKVLHSFNGSDGASPVAGLRVGHHVLYGTTQNGGTNNTGTVFSITSSGNEDVLYSFGAASSGDGEAPEDALVLINNVLYGTTKLGGKHGPLNGTVFSLTTSGAEKVLHDFSASDGLRPRAGLVDVNGVLYGTTQAGGTNGTGTVFSITPSGKHTLLYSFGAFGSGDGERPRSGQLIAHDGVLYGTTERGGYTCGLYAARPQYCGTVFSITTSGVETVLHRFGGRRYSDGAQPEAGLVDVNGVLYGTTHVGGANDTGTVFSITPSGTEKVVYSFGAGGSGDGAMPVARLVLWDKTLYGTTELGGAKNQGTVFSITP